MLKMTQCMMQINFWVVEQMWKIKIFSQQMASEFVIGK